MKNLPTIRDKLISLVYTNQSISQIAHLKKIKANESDYFTAPAARLPKI